MQRIRTLAVVMCAMMAPFALRSGIAQPSTEVCDAVPSSGKIRKAGRYCLSGNITADRDVALEISASDVQLDLRSFEIARDRNASTSLSFGIKVVGGNNLKNVTVRNGRVSGFTIGVSSQGSSHIVFENLEITNSGAIGLANESDHVVMKRLSISGAGIRPLDPGQAYAIGLNLAGRHVQVENVSISDIHRQNVSREIVGEGVGILIRSDCDDCTIKDSHLTNSRAEPGSIGIWNAALGSVDLSGNVITRFEKSIYSAGAKFTIRNNVLKCGSDYKAGVGVVLVLRHASNPDAVGASLNNVTEQCAIESFQCFNSCDPKIAELANRLRLGETATIPDKQ